MTTEEKRKYKLKVNNQEIEREYTDSEIAQQLQKALAADKGLEEVSLTKKQIQAFIKDFLANPFKVALDPRSKIDRATLRKEAEKFLYDEIREEAMDPKDRKLRDLEKFKEDADQKELSAKEEAEKADIDKRTAAAEQRISQTVQKALETSGLPKTPYTVKRIANYLIAGLRSVQNGTATERPSMEKIIEQVRKDYGEDHKSLYSGLEGEALYNMIGEDAYHKLVKYGMTRGNNLRQDPTVIDGKKPRVSKSGEPKTWNEWKNSRRGR